MKIFTTPLKFIEGSRNYKKEKLFKILSDEYGYNIVEDFDNNSFQVEIDLDFRIITTLLREAYISHKEYSRILDTYTEGDILVYEFSFPIPIY